MDAREVLAWLERRGTRRNVQAMARYGIEAPRAFGVPVGTLIGLAKRLGKDHARAAALWESGWYEARLVAPMVDDPRLVTRRQMSAWAAAFDNWAVCDHACWHLFERTPLAWEKARQWTATTTQHPGGSARVAFRSGCHARSSPATLCRPWPGRSPR